MVGSEGYMEEASPVYYEAVLGPKWRE
jgi:hypothetical protein